MMLGLRQNVQKLLDINDEISNHSRKLQELKQVKMDIEDTIQDTLKELNLEDKKFMLNNNLICQKKSLAYQALSLKYVDTCLTNIVDEDTKIRIINLLKSNRSVKEKTEIKIEKK